MSPTHVCFRPLSSCALFLYEHSSLPLQTAERTLMQGRSLVTRWLAWVPSALAFPEEYVHTCCRSWLLVLSSLIASVEDILTRLFEWESRILSVSPCGVYIAQESAIVIIGGGEGLGQTIALNFSEHGHTVFVLYPSSASGTGNTSTQAETASAKSSNVSTLLYAWHKKKERSTHTSWGIVAPISFDTKSEAQRTHAFETVHAYCAKHCLNLAALIVLSPPSPVRRNDFGYREADSSVPLKHHDSISSTWEREGAHFLMESILVVDHFSEMLARASGRVLMLSYAYEGCYFCRPTSLLDGVIKRIGQNLSRRLELIGVRVSSVSVGPITRSKMDEHDAASSQRKKREPGENVCSRLHRTLSVFHDQIGVDEVAFCNDLQSIVSTRYPRYSYTFGIYPFLDSMNLAAPDVLRQLVTYMLR